ncbi:MAG: sulfite exporter TauE/SafE family protein [Chloroflexi bacterium]|nr:sulfite exporter TauE/SafE family protein [Chloroflexota bacterium]
MNSIQQLLPVIVILFVSTFTRSTIGFGDALIAMPLLVMTISVQTATPLVALMGFTIAITILSRNWREVDIKAAWRLIVSALVGIPIGILMLRDAPEQIVRTIMGVVLVLFGLYSLITPRFPTLQRQGFAYIFGFVSGVLGGAYNMNGPPIVIYSALRRWPPERFRATMQGYFFPSGIFFLIGHALAGSLTREVLTFYGYSLPFILLAIFVGGKLNKAIPSGRFERFVHVFLILIGVYLFF